MEQERRKNQPNTEQLISRLERRDRALRFFELVVVLAVLLFNIFLLVEVRNTQDQVRQINAASSTNLKALLEQAKENSEADHQETIRYLRCIALLNPPYVATANKIDQCIATSKLQDSEQNPPITTPSGGNGSSGSSGAGASTNPKAPAPAASEPVTSPTPPLPPVPVIKLPTPNLFQQLLHLMVIPLQKTISAILGS